MECKRKDCYFAHQDAWDPHQTKSQKDRRKPKSVVLEANQAGMSKEEEEAAKLIEGENWWKAAKEGKLAVVRAFIEVGGEGLGREGWNWFHRSVLGGANWSS